MVATTAHGWRESGPYVSYPSFPSRVRPDSGVQKTIIFLDKKRGTSMIFVHQRVFKKGTFSFVRKCRAFQFTPFYLKEFTDSRIDSNC